MIAVETNLKVKKTLSDRIKEGNDWYCDRFDIPYKNTNGCDNRLKAKHRDCEGCNGPQYIGEGKPKLVKEEVIKEEVNKKTNKDYVKKYQDKNKEEYKDKISKIKRDESLTYLFARDGYYYIAYKGIDGEIIEETTGILEQHKHKASTYRNKVLLRIKRKKENNLHVIPKVEKEEHPNQGLIDNLEKSKQEFYESAQEFEEFIEESNVNILFKDYPEIFKKLELKAKDDVRTIEQEIVYIVREYLNGGF